MNEPTLSSQIEALITSEVNKQTDKYKSAIQNAIEILQALVGEPEFTCDTCSDKFVPKKKIVKVRRAYCSDECANKKTHPRLDYSPEAASKRSESQQNRRALEKSLHTETEKKDCKNCGKLTTKLFCTDNCRKEYEAPLKTAADPLLNKSIPVPDLRIQRPETKEMSDYFYKSELQREH